MDVGECNKIPQIVRIRQMLKRWRRKARETASRAPSDVPEGHVAVCVGSSCRRFIVRATYLNHPMFETLLVQAEEEYGFSNVGPLTIPCDEAIFEQILMAVSSGSTGCCHVVRMKTDNINTNNNNNYNHGLFSESRPLLLHGS
ncbi:Auxin_inducible domain-containing protein [Cephalotus follicularis]|uniref:Auxin_inducible domain-containing protein n=1 Tax=Cephalotus follicularis TaxID=3775 RepID=A0A1Q3AX47_CEPFO|nr:Auxin_inducible domain-containing protein [Cephalotus follicularis]